MEYLKLTYTLPFMSFYLLCSLLLSWLLYQEAYYRLSLDLEQQPHVELFDHTDVEYDIYSIAILLNKTITVIAMCNISHTDTKMSHHYVLHQVFFKRFLLII